jgi:hypothetical protein
MIFLQVELVSEGNFSIRESVLNWHFTGKANKNPASRKKNSHADEKLNLRVPEAQRFVNQPNDKQGDVKQHQTSREPGNSNFCIPA